MNIKNTKERKKKKAFQVKSSFPMTNDKLTVFPKFLKPTLPPSLYFAACELYKWKKNNCYVKILKTEILLPFNSFIQIFV